MVTFIDNYINVLDVTYSISRRAGALLGKFQSKGTVRTQADILIAATAIEHNLILVTKNVRDFEDCNAALLNPFS